MPFSPSIFTAIVSISDVEIEPSAFSSTITSIFGSAAVAVAAPRIANANTRLLIPLLLS